MNQDASLKPSALLNGTDGSAHRLLYSSSNLAASPITSLAPLKSDCFPAQAEVVSKTSASDSYVMSGQNASSSNPGGPGSDSSSES